MSKSQSSGTFSIWLEYVLCFKNYLSGSGLIITPTNNSGGNCLGFDSNGTNEGSHFEMRTVLNDNVWWNEPIRRWKWIKWLRKNRKQNIGQSLSAMSLLPVKRNNNWHGFLKTMLMFKNRIKQIKVFDLSHFLFHCKNYFLRFGNLNIDEK